MESISLVSSEFLNKIRMKIVDDEIPEEKSLKLKIKAVGPRVENPLTEYLHKYEKCQSITQKMSNRRN